MRWWVEQHIKYIFHCVSIHFRVAQQNAIVFFALMMMESPPVSTPHHAGNVMWFSSLVVIINAKEFAILCQFHLFHSYTVVWDALCARWTSAEIKKRQQKLKWTASLFSFTSSISSCNLCMRRVSSLGSRSKAKARGVEKLKIYMQHSTTTCIHNRAQSESRMSNLSSAFTAFVFRDILLSCV